MDEKPGGDRASRVMLDGAVIAAIIMQICGGLYWAGVIHQQMQDVSARVDTMEKQERERATVATDVSVRLGRIEQKLADIGQKIGAP